MPYKQNIQNMFVFCMPTNMCYKTTQRAIFQNKLTKN